MKILGIESSCDETAAAVVENGTKIISNVVHSQIDIHKKYGGVVPEVAARSHIEVVNAVVDEAVLDWGEIDAIAVTYAPGLIGSLMVGTLTARTLALLKNKPLYPIHHIRAHIYANFIDQPVLRFPILALVVSGGHTQLVFMKNHQDFRVIGGTRDDAVGECFDKVAKILGLPYPGGPSIAEAAKSGDENAYRLPKSKLDTPYDFSFSGLKTAVLRASQSAIGEDFAFPSTEIAKRLSQKQRQDFAASFQKTAVATLVDGLQKAANDFHPATILLAGGVSANQKLREEVKKRIKNPPIHFPKPALCTDNAAMVAASAFFDIQSGAQPADPKNLEIFPTKHLI
ncbi:MAG: tRNA (adenosine(37)-N6)-threonylcarbamoyltransferase complex transferase subunit TsaD [Candidatus Nomurabacteria bacterium]|jgi:N6-L-threonylcarbamoyladenine synthase|nr:tRNA (adenosine(37)-N6)-threonylcarbamoyltransferase complex transferase subunit TsaD [Candidatus Nomurabacteria bacterium]